MNSFSFKDIDRITENIIFEADVHEGYTLDRIESALEKISDPQNQLKVIHVAGTSGKTSTCYYIAEMLRLAGFSIGLSSSPHVGEVNERVQVNGEPISEEIFCNNISEFAEILNKLSIKLTYFEFYTAFTYWYFAKIGVDYLVVEVGLGGLLDATNTVKRNDKVCVITDIGHDHTDVLGKNIVEISLQKAGIIYQENHVFSYAQPKEAGEVIEKVCLEKKADFHKILQGRAPDFLPEYQKRNWYLAKCVAEFVLTQRNSTTNEDLFIKSAQINIPGRLEEIIYVGRKVYIDGAHNKQKTEALVSSLQKILDGQKVCLIFASGRNRKDQLPEIARLLEPISDKVVLTSFDIEQDFRHDSLSAEELSDYFTHKETVKTIDFDQALQVAQDSKNEIILVTGSLYLVSIARKKLIS